MKVFARYVLIFLAMVSLILAFQNCSDEMQIPQSKNQASGNCSEPKVTSIQILGNSVGVNQYELSNGRLDLAFALNSSESIVEGVWDLKLGFGSVTQGSGLKDFFYSFDQAGEYRVEYSGKTGEGCQLNASANFIVHSNQCVSGVDALVMSVDQQPAQGKSSVFKIDNASSFSGILWRIDRNNDGSIDQELSGDQITLSFNSDDTSLKVYFQGEEKTCQNLRSSSEEFSVALDSSNPNQPVIRSLSIGSDMVRNRVYRYLRANAGNRLNMDISNADWCSYGGQVWENCPSYWEFGALAGTSCKAGTAAMEARNTTANLSTKERFFNFCAAGSSYCVFGPLSERLNNEFCGTSDVSTDFTKPVCSIDSNSVQLTGSSGTVNFQCTDNVEVKAWKCSVGSAPFEDCTGSTYHNFVYSPSVGTTIQLRAEDFNGNISSSVSVEVPPTL